MKMLKSLLEIKSLGKMGRFFLNMPEEQLAKDELERDWFLHYWLNNVMSNFRANSLTEKFNPKFNIRKNLSLVSQKLKSSDKSEWETLQDLSDLYLTVTVPSPGHVKFPEELDMSHFKSFPTPPFKFDYLEKGFFTKSDLGTSIQELKSWLPTESIRLVFNGTKLSDWTKSHEVIRKCQFIDLSFVKIEKGALSLLKIEGLEKITSGDEVFQKILNKYLVGEKDLLDCQEELMEAGYSKEVASL